jgi:cobalt/nickel transport system permease protein
LHIPDGFLSWTWPIYYVIMFVALYFSLKWARKNLDEKLIPLIAVLSAGIFAIMSMNMPIPFGTSGHMLGGALVAIVFLAPEAAVLVLFIVLLVQALFFGDGGITALGANVVNMGLIGGAVAYFSFRGLEKFTGKYPAAAIAAWLSLFIAAEVVAVEMWLAGTFPLDIGLASMGIYHAFIGVIEAILTVVVLIALDKLRPDLLAWNRGKTSGGQKLEESEEVAAK